MYDQVDSSEFYGHNLENFLTNVPRFDDEPISQAAFQAAIESYQPLPTADDGAVMDQQECLEYLKTQM